MKSIGEWDAGEGGVNMHAYSHCNLYNILNQG